MKKKWFSIGIFVFLIVLVTTLVYLRVSARGTNALLSVAYLDVGQGDATLIESPYGTQVLIDGGRDPGVLQELGEVMGYFDRTIDVVIATHPDADHIGGLIDVLERYTVSTIVMTDNVNDTPVSEAFMRAVENEHAVLINARRGQVLDLGTGESGSTTLAVLFPDRNVTNMESNMSSIIVKLSYGDANFLFTGDSPTAIEAYLVGLDGNALESEVLKVGHHGSRTSTDVAFVKAVGPQYGIISAGSDNGYGHPHKEVLDILSAQSVVTKNTADEGSIFLESDGDSIWFK